MAHCSGCSTGIPDIRPTKIPSSCGGCDIDYGDGTPQRMSQRLKRVLEEYDLSKIVDSAIEKHDLNYRYREKALLEYKHFMLMAFKAAKQKRKKWGQVVPTKNADKIWHAHILHTRDYMSFCYEIFGLSYIHHNPGLKEGTASFEAAVADTQKVDASMGKYVIDSDYFGGNQSDPLTECSSCAA